MASRGYLLLAHRQSTYHSPPRHTARWVHLPARLRARGVCGSATVWLCRQTAAMQGIPAAVLYLQWLAQRYLLRLSLSLSEFAIFSPYCLDYFIVRDI